MPSQPRRAVGLPDGREDQVIELAARGMTDKEIAASLGISPETVGTYWRRVMARLGASTRTQAVATAQRQRIAALEAEVAEVSALLADTRAKATEREAENRELRRRIEHLDRNVGLLRRATATMPKGGKVERGTRL